MLWRSSPGATVALALVTLAAAVLYPLSVYIGKRIIDAVVAVRSHPGAGLLEWPGPVVHWLLLELATASAIVLVERGLGLTRMVLGARLGVDVNVQILEKALVLDLAHFENAAYYDRLVRARREASSRPLALVQGYFTILKNALTLVGYLGLLARFSGWGVVVVLLASVPAFLAETRFSGTAFRMRNWRSPESRRLAYLEHVLTSDQHAKEVKTFGVGGFLLGRYRNLAEGFFQEDRRLEVRRFVWSYLLSILSTVTFYGCYAAIALATVAGKLTLGDMALYLSAFRQAQQAFQGLLAGCGAMYEDNLYISNLFEYLAIEPAPRRLAPSPVTSLVVASETQEGIRFEDVGFCYPEATTWALRDVNLFIPRRQSLALVGENGAGKTTLIKLLARLYRPTKGRILLDGKDLADWDEQALRTRLGLVFQDFNQYQMTVRENVGLGSVQHLEDELRVRRALEQGGARELVATLAAGLDSQLGRWFAGGADLSGGQWQKIALARAFMREEADILVLDEPTAALDAESEHAVFERFQVLARGRTTILISHRFATVRMAERILVLEQGRVTEDGSHAQLLDRGARYAYLFGLQARGYR